MSSVRYVITKYKNGILSFTYDIQANKMVSVCFTSADMLSENVNIGDIYVAKVINVVRQLNAAFIHYAPGKKGYLPLQPAYEPVIINRKYDGRIVAGDEILVQLEKEAVRTKEPVFTINLSLSGKYSVVSNANTYKGVSRKCSKSERERLRTAIPQDVECGVVIRTNAASLLDSSDESDCDALQPVTDEVIRLKDRLSTLLQEGIHRTCYSRIWQSLPIYLANMRDEGIRYQQIITDDETIYHETAEFASVSMPEQLHDITLYQDAD